MVAGRGEQRGVARGVLGDASDALGHDRQPAGERFQQDIVGCCLLGRVQETARRSILREELLVSQAGGKTHARETFKQRAKLGRRDNFETDAGIRGKGFADLAQQRKVAAKAPGGKDGEEAQRSAADRA